MIEFIMTMVGEYYWDIELLCTYVEDSIDYQWTLSWKQVFKDQIPGLMNDGIVACQGLKGG